MVNPESPALKISARIGYLASRIVRIILTGNLVILIDGKLVGSKPI
jgi:hypothetical protein